MCRVEDDLQQELSYLHAQVFPYLDSLCLARGTCFRPVDLQQSKDGGDEDISNQTSHKTPALSDQQLKIRLDLIDRSTFFICLLGYKYGEFDSTFDIGPCSFSEMARNLHVAAMSGYPWVTEDECGTCCLTELEIIKASFQDEHRTCFFYFKDYTPQDNMENISDEMLMSLSELYTENHSVRRRMRNLKRRIIGRCLPVRFFRNLHELGMMMRNDWEGVINQFYGDPEYPIAGRQDLLDLRYHESHGRALCDWFVPSTQATKILNTFNTFVHPVTKHTKSEMHLRNREAHFKCDLGSRESEKSVLLVCGERGCGKSTLAARWLQTFCRENPDVPIISHFCGTSTSSTDVRSMLRQWTAELQRVHYDWDGVLEDETELEPLHQMVQAFSAAVQYGPCVLLLDGIDLLTETFGLSVQEVKELRWLPDALPPHCKCIITTTFTDLTYKSLNLRTDVHTLTCPHLSDPIIHRSVLLKHLSLPCKELPTHVFQRIAAKKLCHLPAFLALLGTEMRSCGVQREKEEEIELLEEYIDVDSMPELWVKVVLRWVKDYNGSRSRDMSQCKATSHTTNAVLFTEDLSGWVWDTLCLIHLSHAGLTEAEILALLKDLGYHGNPKDEVLEWARLRSVFWPWVQEKANGHLTIMHQSFSQAMNLLLLDSRGQVKSQNDFNQILADFFQKSSLQLCSWVRKMEEIPWYLMQMGSFTELHSFLSDPVIVEALSNQLEQNPKLTTDVIHYWTLLRDRGFDPASSFQFLMFQACRIKDLDERTTWRLSLFCAKVLLCFGESHQTEKLLLQTEQNFQRVQMRKSKGEELDGNILKLVLKVQHMLANLYVQMHRLKDAEMYCHKALQTAQHLTDSTEVQLIVGQMLCCLCLILLEDGRLNAAPGLLKEISCDRHMSDHPRFKGTVLFLKAIHKLSLNELEEAERCLRAARSSRRGWYGSEHPLVAEVEEQLADLWVDTQSHTEWERRKIVEVYRHVLSIKETEAQTLQQVNLQQDLYVILVKFGKFLLRSSSKAERREGLDLLQRASDIRILILGHEHPLTRELQQNEEIYARGDQDRLKQETVTEGITHAFSPTATTNKVKVNYYKTNHQTLKDLIRLFGPQSDIRILLPREKGLHTSRPRKACKFSHNIQSKHNYPLLRECTLHELNEDDLFLLLLQNDPTLLPEVCAHYNKGSGLFGSCTFMERCTKVHICQHFVQDACLFGPKCKRQHSIDEHSRRMLEERGLGGDLIHDLPYIYQNVHRLNLQTLQNELISEPGLNPVAQTEKNEICLHFIRGKCKFQDQCVLVHFNLPYKWEVNDGKSWRDLRNMEDIERAYCDPKNEHSPGSRRVDLLSMTRNRDPVRRLSTVSSVSKPNHYILTTEWVWYYKGDHENWMEYGKPDDKQRVTSVTSRELEKAYVEDSTAEVTVIKGNRHYFVSFPDMYQRNPKHNTKRKVRRRPRFVSVNDVEGKAAQ
ncbi:Tetratricopeptide repeat protein 41 [Triplophysa tibetana]|uniref:Tetratricopeptide repeat protein 41 n=1 Tax=Triplophysa tibetana TaxID=1572043 RepID=A0A5A9PIX7_9TELE|nr:Tetratricopeptide repeat protein 41 [Triplophysa tibetana]